MVTYFADCDLLMQFEAEMWFVVNDYLFSFGFPTTTALTFVETPVYTAPNEESENGYGGNCN